MTHSATQTLVTLVAVFLLTACASGPENNPTARVNIKQIDVQLEKNVPHKKSDALFHFYKTWHKTPYRYGGNSRKGVDCSGFVKIAFSQLFHQSIPRTTHLQSHIGTQIDYEDRQYGDLVFFKTGYNMLHVGFYLEDNSFMHASSSKGVIISRLDSPYWADTFWQIRRVN
ncbi:MULTISPECIES: C40 family peptidase [Vibrio]|uniref:Peptidase C40 family protein n=1 Tax=Vibrio halioticoli NBRC 102217 TaxID=1219072 RepID=V5FIA1_9VIBR|nr:MULTISPECIES: NlpC/P60 family protein [Vibrio]MPW36519.1 hydrolase [Vibrio sp. B1Z05]GAD89561.1 peptidase C40 family protein [Vibrio halioticoli NBRC 102217]